MKKIILTLTFILVAIFAMSSCLDMGSLESPAEQTEEYRVMLSLPDGVSVEGDNPLKVKEGDSAKFKLVFDSSHMFESVSHGTFDPVTHEVLIENVTDDVNAILEVNEHDFDTTVRYDYIFNGTALDVSDVRTFSSLCAGTKVTVHANDQDRKFIGWSFEKTYNSGGIIVNTERDFTFVMNGDYADKLNTVVIYPNYVDTNIINYHPNGGQINTKSVNMQDRTYYTTSVGSLGAATVVKVRVRQTYLDKVASYSTFYDDGTFYRDGYVLIEYNTAPDGSGEAYSLGSKVYMSENTEDPTLYCIWERETPQDSFVFTDISIPRPDKVTVQNSPDWQENGVIISSYTGNAKTVVIPEKIGDKYVIAIDTGAFVGKDVETLVLNRRIIKVADGAFQNCTKIKTVYFPDGIYEMKNEAFDAASYTSFKKLYVNATMAPRHQKSLDGAHAIKLSRLLEHSDKNRIIIIGGSSIYEGLGSEYLEALLDGEYAVINFGTTRTTHGTMYLEAMAYYAHEGDVIVYAPENSSYMMGERELYWKSLRDLEGMNNIYRHIDISNYTNVFTAFTELNQNLRYTRTPNRYEDVAGVSYTDAYGDHTRAERQYYCGKVNYIDCYFPSLNNKVKSRFDEDYKANALLNKEDYNNPDNVTWCAIDDPYYLEPMNKWINLAKSSGAKVYFGYCPCDADKLVDAAMNVAWLRAYDELIARIYDFDGAVGRCEDYIYNHAYFYDSAFHLNDYGRTYRTYQFYVDIAEILGIENTHGIYDLGRDFSGCLFEDGSDGTPTKTVDYLSEG